jgi:hypothetical protein
VSAFPNTLPADLPSSQLPHRRVSESLSTYWRDNVPESLKTYGIPNENAFKPICMTPTDEQVGRMYARSKCMELLGPEHPSLLSHPTRTIPLCFVARAAEGLPIHIQKTLFFFASVLHGLVDMAHYAAPTIATNVVHDRSDPRVLRGLVSTGAGMVPDPRLPEDDRMDDSGFISIDEILEERAADSEETNEPVPPLSIHIGFTGATFKDSEGKERREVFAVLMVRDARSFSSFFFF